MGTLGEEIGEGQNEEITRRHEEILRIRDIFIIFIVITCLVHAYGKI